MSATPIRLSKSKIASFEHCAKRLWLQVHRRTEARFDEATLARFQFGHDVGKRARFLVPEGILVETGMDMAAAIAETAALIEREHRAPIFEATFQHENVLVRVDILQPVAGGWEIVEVKAASRVGHYHYSDIATQVWVARGSGVNVTKATIRHLAKRVDWHHPDIGGVTLQDTEVTGQIERFVATRSRLAIAASATLGGPTPERPMGSYCYRPLACEFRHHCTDEECASGSIECATKFRPERRNPNIEAPSSSDR
jgi:hypothetical protein